MMIFQKFTYSRTWCRNWNVQKTHSSSMKATIKKYTHTISLPPVSHIHAENENYDMNSCHIT
jgi:hypothetical protein